MFRVGKQLPLLVISPRPWSPLDWLIRRWRPAFRPKSQTREVVDGFEVYRPNYMSLPGVAKRLDGWSMSRAIMNQIKSLDKIYRPTLIDAHFLYPDGYASSIVASELGIPLVVTIRGSKDERLIGTSREFGLRRALAAAHSVVAVSEQLAQSVAFPMNADPDTVNVIGNGVNQSLFYPEERQLARLRLKLPADAKILVTVGALIGLKGFHRVVDLLPRLMKRWPNLHYLVVGGRAGHDDMEPTLREMVAERGLESNVHFCGPQPPEELRWYYSAADLFVLATEFEGWANVLLESMACATPVITTDVGGNRQVVCDSSLGTVCPYWDEDVFMFAIDEGLKTQWNRSALIEHASRHSWDAKIPQLLSLLRRAISTIENSADRPVTSNGR